MSGKPKGGAGAAPPKDVVNVEETRALLAEIAKENANVQLALNVFEREIEQARARREEAEKARDAALRHVSSLQAQLKRENPGGSDNDDDDGERVKVQVRSKTEREYRRCGIMFKPVWGTYEVSEHVVLRIREDAHLDVKDVK